MRPEKRKRKPKLTEYASDVDEIAAMRGEIDALKAEVEKLKKQRQPASSSNSRRLMGYALWWLFLLVLILIVSQLPPMRFQVNYLS
jgi:uncharacterized small protein (DUF1192 family)